MWFLQESARWRVNQRDPISTNYCVSPQNGQRELRDGSGFRHCQQNRPAASSRGRAVADAGREATGDGDGRAGPAATTGRAFRPRRA
jgi:hypothetical protein